MSGKRIKQIAKIIKYGQHEIIFQSQMKHQIKKTTPSAINVLKEIAFQNKVVSLSANQIGLEQRMFVCLKNQFLIPGKWRNYELNSMNQYQAIVNPKEIQSSNQEFCHFQECPSFEGIIFKIWAPMKIKVTYFQEQDLKKEKERTLQGFEGRIWEHEIRHLQGILPIHFEVSKGEFFLAHDYKQTGYNVQIFETMKKRENFLTKKNAEKLKEMLNTRKEQLKI